MKRARTEALAALLALAPAVGREGALAQIDDAAVRAEVCRAVGILSRGEGAARAKGLLAACAGVMREELR